VTRVLIADDHPVVREGVRRVLQRAVEIEVVGEVGRGDDVMPAVLALRPDVLVLDITMPGADFLAVLADLQKLHAGLHTLILSAHPEEGFAVRAFRAGALGYLTKGYAPADLVDAVRSVAQGRRYVTPALAEHLAVGLGGDDGSLPHERLSNREFEVLRSLAAGRSLKEIAAQLGINPKTVSTFRARVPQKLGVRTNAGLVRYALEHHLT
jgi:two-component system, NarL family, invasion response regulator UvrY